MDTEFKDSDSDSDWYIKAMHHELSRVTHKEFHGEIKFVINIQKGAVVTCHTILDKSIKRPYPIYDLVRK